MDRYDWAAMRSDIESGRVKSFALLSEKYGCSEQAIRNRRKADEKAGNPWKHPLIARAQDENVIDLAQHRKHTGKVGGGGSQSSRKSDDGGGEGHDVPDEPLEFEENKVDPLEEQTMLGVMAQRAVRRAMRRYLRGKLTPGMHQSEADVVNALTAAGKNAILINREIAGKTKGEASDNAGDGDEPVEVVIRTERIAPANRAEVLSQAAS